MPLTLTRPDLIRSANFIAGQWTNCPAGLLDVTDPATGDVITRVPDSGAPEALAALDAAHAAFPAWRKVPAKQRAAIIKRWNDLVLAHQDDLGKLISREQGKPLAEGMGEVAYAASYIEWFGEQATRLNGEIIPTHVSGRRVFALKEPVGVVAAITPWNFPAAMIARKIAPALAAGCTVVCKPAEDTPLSTYNLTSLPPSRYSASNRAVRWTSKPRSLRTPCLLSQVNISVSSKLIGRHQGNRLNTNHVWIGS